MSHMSNIKESLQLSPRLVQQLLGQLPRSPFSPNFELDQGACATAYHMTKAA